MNFNAKPEGFCDEAWKAIYQYAFALAHGAGQDVFYYGDWIRKPGVQRRPAPGPLQARGHAARTDPQTSTPLQWSISCCRICAVHPVNVRTRTWNFSLQ